MMEIEGKKLTLIFRASFVRAEHANGEEESMVTLIFKASFVRAERTNGEDEINGQSAQMEKKKPMAEQWRRREALERANSVKGEGFGGGKILRIRVRFSE